VYVPRFNRFVDGGDKGLCRGCRDGFVSGGQRFPNGFDLVFHRAGNAAVDQRPGFSLAGAFCGGWSIGHGKSDGAKGRVDIELLGGCQWILAGTPQKSARFRGEGSSGAFFRPWDGDRGGSESSHGKATLSPAEEQLLGSGEPRGNPPKKSQKFLRALCSAVCFSGELRDVRR
jgi:hypothetical protein